MKPDEIIKIVTDSGLRGRGGAGFSAGQKWSFIPKEKKGPHYLAVNADEIRAGHVQGPLPDRLTTRTRCSKASPSRAKATQCDVAYIFIRGEYHRQAKVLEQAIKEAYEKKASSASRGSSAPATSSNATSTAAPARTSAAKRPACSKPWKASAAGRATSRRSRRSPARSPGRRSSTTSRRSAASRRSSDERRPGLVQVDGHQEQPRPQALRHERPRQQARRLRGRTGHHPRLRHQQAVRRHEGRQVQGRHLRRHLHGRARPRPARHQARLRRRPLPRRVPGPGHRRHDRHERAHRHGRRPAQLRPLLRPRILRPMHALPRRQRLDDQDPQPHHGRHGPAPATSTC